jgi:hypothetical protein
MGDDEPIDPRCADCGKESGFYYTHALERFGGRTPGNDKEAVAARKLELEAVPMEAGNRCHFCFVKSLGQMYPDRINTHPLEDDGPPPEGKRHAPSQPPPVLPLSTAESQRITDGWFAGADPAKLAQLRASCALAASHHPTTKGGQRPPAVLWDRAETGQPTVACYVMGHNHHPEMMTCGVPTPPMGPKAGPFEGFELFTCCMQRLRAEVRKKYRGPLEAEGLVDLRHEQLHLLGITGSSSGTPKGQPQRVLHYSKVVAAMTWARAYHELRDAVDDLAAEGTIRPVIYAEPLSETEPEAECTSKGGAQTQVGAKGGGADGGGRGGGG